MRSAEAAVVAPSGLDFDGPCYACDEEPVGIHAELGYPACDDHVTARVPDAEDGAYLRAAQFDEDGRL